MYAFGFDDAPLGQEEVRRDVPRLRARCRAATSGCPDAPGITASRALRAKLLSRAQEEVQVPADERLHGALGDLREGPRLVRDGPDAGVVVLAQLPVLLGGRASHGGHPLGVVVPALDGVPAHQEAYLDPG